MLTLKKSIKKPPVALPAIFVTFYYADDENLSAESKTRWLVEQLSVKLNLSSDPAHPYSWESSDEHWGAPKLVLTRFTPVIPHAQDIKIAQLMLSDTREDRPATLVWPKMRALLEQVLNDDTLRDIYGYTLIYQAVLPDPTDQNQTFSDMLSTVDLEELLEVTKPLHLPPNYKPLDGNFVLDKKGKVWLLNTPNLNSPTYDNQLETGTVYLALSLESSNHDIVNQIISGPNASLLRDDLMAHDRQFYDQQKQQSRYQIRTLADSTIQRLERLDSKTETESQFDTLANQYGQSLSYITQLNRLRFSLSKQLYDYSLWKDESEGGPVIAYHAKQMQASLKELELKVEERRSSLQATKIAFDIAKARMQRQQAQRRQRAGILLALAGAALTVSQFIDPSAAGALLNWWGWTPAADGYDRLLTLGVQFGVTIAVVVLLIFVTWLLPKLYMLLTITKNSSYKLLESMLARLGLRR